MIKLYAVGGFSEVGRNMTALQIDDDVIVFDCGLYLPPIVELEAEERNKGYSEKRLREIDGVPDDLILDKLGLRSKVRAILVSHAHLDHVGAIPYLSDRYNAEIAATPYTIEVLKSILNDNGIKLKNNLKSITPNSSYTVKGKKNYQVEFLNVTHSTIQAALIAVHTPKGVVIYANDFKFDDFPILGKKPNYERLKELAKEGVLAVVVDSLYSSEERKTPSERIARDLLEDVLFTVENKNASIFITTFSSHIARLKSIVDFGKKLNRKVVFLGRSLHKYVDAAIKVDLCPFAKDIVLTTYTNEVKKALKKVELDRSKYLIVCTGHQAEKGSVLDRIVNDATPFRLTDGDNVIFSSSVIPVEVNIKARAEMDKKLKKKGVRIQSDIHVSGHGSREDLRDLIEILNPEHIIPAHGEHRKTIPMMELAGELGYKAGQTVHLSSNGKVLKF